MEDRGYNEKRMPGEATDITPELGVKEEGNKEHKTVLDGVPRSRGWSVVSLASGIISIIIAVICLFCQTNALPFVSMGFGAAAILFPLLSRRNLGYFDGMAVAGIITGAMGLVFGIANYLLATLMNA